MTCWIITLPIIAWLIFERFYWRNQAKRWENHYLQKCRAEHLKNLNDRI